MAVLSQDRREIGDPVIEADLGLEVRIDKKDSHGWSLGLESSMIT